MKRGSPIRCSLHKENMKLVSLICRCGKVQPTFNNPNEKKPICCFSCKTPTMVDIKHRVCKCGLAQPNFNQPNEKIAICCFSCKTPTMVNVKSKKCKCGLAQPIYNEPNEKIAICCVSCKTPTMVDVNHTKCRCGLARPTYNEPNEKTAICCISCKTSTMVDVNHKKCKCGLVIPSFNEPNEKTAICCFSCKTPTMVDVVNKKCRCGLVQPTYNEPNEQTAICCVSCKTPTMVDVNHKICLGAIKDNINYECPYKMLGNKKYKNYCTRCFLYNFPTDPLTFQIRCKTKEIAVRDFINSNFEGFQHDKILETGHCDCSIRRRIDHRKLIGNTLLVIETDENQHKSYDQMDEQTRYDDLYMAFSGKWIYIRFNPDKYLSKKNVSKNPMISSRLAKLKSEIETQIKRIQKEENTELIERIYMYYDGYD